MYLVHRMGRRRLNRLLSLILLAVFALRALPAWAARAAQHCAAHEHTAHQHSRPAMAGMDMPQPSGAAFPVVSEQTPQDDGCTHCPPADCEVTSPCATNPTAGLPADTAPTSPPSARSTVILTTRHGATSAVPDLLTPPPRSLL